MKKEFVPYEEAFDMKVLGFDEPCLAFYERNKELIIQECLVSDFAANSLQCVAQTFSQAFRWFREKHDIIFYLNMVDVNLYYYVIGTEPFLHYGTYEEAELECLRKLIEIVKNKNNE